VPDETWQQRKHAEVFEAVCRHLRRRRRDDPSFTLAQLEGLLQSAYVNEGLDWTGRGPVAQVTHAATIAALEHTLAEWRHETDL